MMKFSVTGSFVVAALSIVAAACGGSQESAKAPSGEGAPTTSSASGAASASGAGVCDQIDERCDPFEKQGGVAKECHDLAEGPNAKEDVCVRRKDECFAACTKK